MLGQAAGLHKWSFIIYIFILFYLSVRLDAATCSRPTYIDISHLILNFFCYFHQACVLILIVLD
jgi:hypothetical protein